MKAERVLFVDDDENVLAGISRQMRKADFSFQTATSGADGLFSITNSGPFAVVVSDMKMPEMDGIEFLRQVEQESPDTVRLMLTGNGDVTTAIQAVNQGHVFRFLTKPCPPEELERVVNMGIDQYRLVNSERDLLEGTLVGAVKALTEVLTLANPEAFQRASRVRVTAKGIAELLAIDEAWKVELAAMLSQIGLVTLPRELADQILSGASFEWVATADIPSLSQRLIEHIPRLGEVAKMIGYQEIRYDEAEGRMSPEQFGGHILKVASDYEQLIASQKSGYEALKTMNDRMSWYAPNVLHALSDLINSDANSSAVTIPIAELKPGMIVTEDACDENGSVLVKSGQVLTAASCHLLRFSGRAAGSIRVHIKEA